MTSPLNHSLHRPLALLVAMLLATYAGTSSAEEPSQSALPKVDYAREIEPLLRRSCYSCHGSEVQESGLRLDDRARAMMGGDLGPVIAAGKSADSRLARVLDGSDDELEQMPPEGKGKPLSAGEVALIRRWIDEGATWPQSDATKPVGSDHWAWQPLVVHEVDQQLLAGRGAARENFIDDWVQQRLAREKIAPAPAAPKHTQLRRVYFDLLGLLPTPEEAAKFTSSTAPDAYEQLLDRLLASPHFGERWGRHWLDLARYADSDGYEKDKPREFAFRYRDWVIESLNSDLPFDQFAQLQIAGDMLATPADPQGTIASGFHRNTLHNAEGGIDPEEDRTKKTVDRINTVGSVFLGLTVGCAQCHTHKYDPITQREYFSLYAMFNSADEVNPDVPRASDQEQLAKAMHAYEKRLKKLESDLAQWDAEQLALAIERWETSTKTDEKLLEKLPENLRAILARDAAARSDADREVMAQHVRDNDAERAKLAKEIADHRAKRPALRIEAKVQSLVERKAPRETRLHIRGDFLSPGDVVQPGTPAALPKLSPRGSTADRIDLAHWMTSDASPLVARVLVNRVWLHLFGKGLVTSSDDFGKQGSPPTHPELLDALAADFIEHDWSLKHLLRTIMRSHTYRQSSVARPELMAIDPDNSLLARQVRRRIEAELIRDISLAAAGDLATQIGGASVRPPQPAEYASLTYAGSAKWTESTGSDRYRRGMYTFFQRTSPYPMLMTFDCPDSNETSPRRQISNTPLQALTLFNDPVFYEAAAGLARRVQRDVPAAESSKTEAGDAPLAEQIERQRIDRLVLICLARPASSSEAATLAKLVDAQRTASLAAGHDPQRAEQEAWHHASRVMLNLDQFMTRE
ncbi:protein of unknown function DUF1549 [Pirellula staleyi DSM 6068]|uniref:Cytochrome c domain-containing protein n=1 Tax=Pirellula staleyi (strain ATCC 27377 / DSM 6068 / ICPB 4128) TaxID=530564 RepID=D2R6V1_PIRSD|nr:PSD1 and planctomycete cytochrome C domain-containing protein [Pirellula staleyi]ADB17401.1 protein of unknown function DUF1549 [Pirellula staleyi DSM 6068]